MRGLFTAGVLDVFMENGISFDGAIGVSAGAAFGCNLKSRQPGRVIRYNKRFARNPRYCSWTSLLKTGDLFGADFCYRELPLELDLFDCATYDANPMEFHLSVTDCETGKAFLICPDAALPISRVCHDPDVIQKVYDIGRTTAERPLPKVREFLG